jgi:hypothetical protein
LLVTENALHLFIDGRYTQQAQQQTQGVEICEIPVGGNIIDNKALISNRPCFKTEYRTLKKRSQYFNYVAANRNFTNFDPIKALLIFKL